jgi:anti-sigma factor ChrR (cupin superfamily)
VITQHLRIATAILYVALAGELAAMGSCESEGAAVVHCHRAAAERPRREQLELPRRGQTALVQGRAVAGEPGMNEELVLVNQLERSSRSNSPQSWRLPSTRRRLVLLAVEHDLVFLRRRIGGRTVDGESLAISGHPSKSR